MDWQVSSIFGSASTQAGVPNFLDWYMSELTLRGNKECNSQSWLAQWSNLKWKRLGKVTPTRTKICNSSKSGVLGFMMESYPPLLFHVAVQLNTAFEVVYALSRSCWEVRLQIQPFEENIWNTKSLPLSSACYTHLNPHRSWYSHDLTKHNQRISTAVTRTVTYYFINGTWSC